MERAPRTTGIRFLLSLLARLKHALCPPRHEALQLVVLTSCVQTIIPLRMAAFQANWAIHFALSLDAATALLRQGGFDALIYDLDSREYDWRTLCRSCVEHGVLFHLVATMPSDDLFLAVVGAGGSGVLWKPLTAERMMDAFDSLARHDAIAQNHARDSHVDSSLP
jgi:hypothetical protein